MENEPVEGEVADRSAQAGVLGLELLEPLRLAHLEAAVLLAKAVAGDRVDARGLDHLRDLPAFARQDLGLAQLADDLLRGGGSCVA